MIRNKAAVGRALAALSASPETAATAGDLGDLRVLAQALVEVMVGASQAQGGASGQQQQQQPTRTAEGKVRAVSHKHVLASLGPRGVLWAAQAEAFRGLPLNARGPGTPTVALSADGSVGFLHLPAEPLPEGLGAANTNGCGDAFCAGLVAAMLGGEGLGLAAVARGQAAARAQLLRGRDLRK